MQNSVINSNVIPFPTRAITARNSDALPSELSEQIRYAEPRVRLADAILASTTSCTVNELAKVLRQNGINIGQNRLYKRLRTEGYLCSRKHIRNLPTQTAMNSGYFEIRETPFTTWNSTPKTNRTVLVTAKGLGHFIDKYLPGNGGAES